MTEIDTSMSPLGGRYEVGERIGRGDVADESVPGR